MFTHGQTQALGNHSATFRAKLHPKGSPRSNLTFNEENQPDTAGGSRRNDLQGTQDLTPSQIKRLSLFSAMGFAKRELRRPAGTAQRRPPEDAPFWGLSKLQDSENLLLFGVTPPSLPLAPHSVMPEATPDIPID
jgi:hypothetical protein